MSEKFKLNDLKIDMDSKVVFTILAVTVTAIAAIVYTRKCVMDKKNTTIYEKKVLRRKQRSIMRSLTIIEDDSKKMLNEIKKVQGIILDFLLKKDTTKEESTEIEQNEKKEEEDKSNDKPILPQKLIDIRVDNLSIDMKIKGLDEYLLRMLEQLDSLRPNALLDEAREMVENKPEIQQDIMNYIEHKIEKIKKKKKSMVIIIQKYLDNIDKLALTVSGKNDDIELVKSVSKLWEEVEEKNKENDKEKTN